PRVGLMNVGEEPGKGNDLAKETYPLLEQTPGIVFAGNVEGRDVLAGAADVIVMDGFVGNVLLKFGESLKGALPQMMGAAVQRLGLDAAQHEAMTQVLAAVGKGFDYESAGGAPLLGVAGNVVIGHGSSSAKAIASMIRAGAAMAEAGVAPALAEALAPTA
ncbi:MAG: phosphate acyltransferase, partial [Rhodothermales bacterium]|nr:phosphate acyltransferase [Rhodothermales bacterium]